MDIPVELQGEQLLLLPERVLYWPRAQTLVIADPHLGKAAAFRAGGVPVPEATTADTLQRLGAALDRTGARRLLCLGDLLHARAGRAPETLALVTAWREQYPIPFLLVRGNHDHHAGDPPAEWAVQCLEEPFVEWPFVWRHFPEADATGYALTGHLHPAVRLGRGSLGETLPCFYFGRQVGILPAFGAFTGTALVRPQAGDRAYVLAGPEILPVHF